MSDEVALLAFRPNLFVHDVQIAFAFYRDVLGMVVRVEFPDGSFALLGGGGAEVALVKSEHSAPGEAYLTVRGVDSLLGKCESAGFAIVRALDTRPWGLRDFVVRDADGNLIGIGERVQPAE